MKKILLILLLSLSIKSYSQNNKINIVFNCTDSSQCNYALNLKNDTLFNNYTVTVNISEKFSIEYLDTSTDQVLGVLYSHYMPLPNIILIHAESAEQLIVKLVMYNKRK